MTFEEYDGKFIVGSTMEWFPYPECPIPEMSEDTYMYFAVADAKGAYAYGSYLGDELKEEDNYGHVILSNDNIYAWSLSTLEPPNMQGFKTGIKEGKPLIYGVFNISETDIPFYDIKLDRNKTSTLFTGTYDECQNWIDNN